MVVIRRLLAVFVLLLAPVVVACNNTGELSPTASEKDVDQAEEHIITAINSECGVMLDDAR